MLLLWGYRHGGKLAGVLGMRTMHGVCPWVVLPTAMPPLRYLRGKRVCIPHVGLRSGSSASRRGSPPPSPRVPASFVFPVVVVVFFTVVAHSLVLTLRSMSLKCGCCRESFFRATLSDFKAHGARPTARPPCGTNVHPVRVASSSC